MEKEETEELCNRESVSPEFDADNELLLQQIAELKAQVNKLSIDKDSFEKLSRDRLSEAEKLRTDKENIRTERNKIREENKRLKQLLEEKSTEQAFNATGKECFTKAKMGLLVYTISSLTDGDIPVKAKLVPIIAAIGGWEDISVMSEMKKGGFKKEDIDTVADLFKDVMPNFSEKIRKQISRRPKAKK